MNQTLPRLLSEEEEQKELDKLANLVVGSVSIKDHPEWATRTKLQKWLKSLRSEWK